MVARTPQDADKFIVRLPDGMREQIAAAARNSKRSMNAEVIDRLQRTFDHDSRFSGVGQVGLDDIVTAQKFLQGLSTEDSEMARALMRTLSAAEDIRDDAQTMLERHLVAAAARAKSGKVETGAA